MTSLKYFYLKHISLVINHATAVEHSIAVKTSILLVATILKLLCTNIILLTQAFMQCGVQSGFSMCMPIYQSEINSICTEIIWQCKTSLSWDQLQSQLSCTVIQAIISQYMWILKYLPVQHHHLTYVTKKISPQVNLCDPNFYWKVFQCSILSTKHFYNRDISKLGYFCVVYIKRICIKYY